MAFVPESADEIAGGPQGLTPSRLSEANINPRTFLATDYLNHFNEVIMLVELIPSMPEVAEDVLDWVPKSYIEHFGESKFREKELAVAAWHAARPSVRAALGAVVVELEATIHEAKDLVRGVTLTSPEFAEMANILIHTRFRPLIDRASSIINGVPAHDVAADHLPHPSAQESIDELFP